MQQPAGISNRGPGLTRRAFSWVQMLERADKRRRLFWGAERLSKKEYLLLRHGISVAIIVAGIVFVVLDHGLSKAQQTGVVFVMMIPAFQLYFERCGNCRGLIWHQRKNYLFNKFVGPFYLPMKCGQCGSPDFEHPPGDAD